MRAAFVCMILGLGFSAVHAAEHAEAVMRATFKIYNKDSTATGFVLRDGDENFLVSAAHTFERSAGTSSILVLREKMPDGHYERRDRTVPIRKGDQPLWTRHPQLDVAALKLDPVIQVEHPLPLECVEAADFPKFGDTLLLLTYPARVEANGAGFPLARQAVVASFPARPMNEHAEFIVDATSWDGDSGGPVFQDAGEGRPKIFGLVIARINNIETTESDNEKRRVETPMGLSKVLPGPVIIDTIRRAQMAAPPK